MNRFVLGLAFAPLLSLAAGCGRPFKIETAPGMVELDNQGPQYDYRALAPDGVVIAVHTVDTGDRGDIEFWTRATVLRMRQLSGYALLEARDVTSRDGTPGRELRFGHDENGKPYLYTLRLFIAQGRLFLIESGGPRDQVERYAPTLKWMQANVKLQCSTLGAPILSSRTCNRW